MEPAATGPPHPGPAWPARTTAELRAAKPSPETFSALPRAPIRVLLDDVRSLANVGLIFRLCDAARIERLQLCGITGHPPFPSPERDPRLPSVQQRALREITKTAVMAVPFVPWEYRPSALEALREARAQGRQVVAVEQAHGSRPYTTPGIYRPPLTLVFGHERAGVAPAALAEADACVEIPVYGMANSLNVAMACALVVYEVLRQHANFGFSGFDQGG
jgi:23S rRNA (guanosine2251-2'-O)-methyltransferase